MVKAWDEDGSRRDITAAEIHRFDQMHSRFRAITDTLVGVQREAEDIFFSEDAEVRAELAELHQQIQQLLRELLEDGSAVASSYIMYLISLIVGFDRESARRERLARVLFEGLSVMLHPDDDFYALGGDTDDIQDRLKTLFPEPEQTSPTTYLTGTGQKLVNVHPKEACEGFCVIHNPCPGPWELWPTNWRGDDAMGLDIWRGFERICPCGTGHPAVEEIMRGNNPGTHGCCGVCRCGPADCITQRDAEGNLVGFE
jgi:hypothetical protein